MKKALVVLGIIFALFASTCMCGINHAHAGELTGTAGIGMAVADVGDGTKILEDDNNLELFVTGDYLFGRFIGVQGRVSYANLDLDDTVNVTAGFKFQYPARVTPYLVVGGGWQNTGFLTEGAKQIGTAALGLAGDLGPVGLGVEYRLNVFNENLQLDTIDATNGSVLVGLRFNVLN